MTTVAPQALVKPYGFGRRARLERTSAGGFFAVARTSVKAARVEAGLCEQCGRRPPDLDRLYCRSCLDRYNSKAKARHYAKTGARPRSFECGLCGSRSHTRRRCAMRTS